MPVYASLYSKYFSAKDFKDNTRILAIKSAAPENVSVDGDDVKIVLYFTGDDKRGLILSSKVNYNKVCEIFGSEDTDAWVGGKIEVYFEPAVMFAGKEVGGFRIRPANAG